MVHLVPEVMIKVSHKLPYNYPIWYPVDTGFQCCDSPGIAISGFIYQSV